MAAFGAETQEDLGGDRGRGSGGGAEGDDGGGDVAGWDRGVEDDPVYRNSAAGTVSRNAATVGTPGRSVSSASSVVGVPS